MSASDPTTRVDFPSGDEATLRLRSDTQPQAASDVAPAEALPVLLGRFRLVRELGRGGMGVVYLANDLDLGRSVAVKVLPMGCMTGPEARVRFRREAETASRLNHPNLCGVLQVGETDGVAWLAMPFVAGRSLQEELRVARELAAGGAAAAGASEDSVLAVTPRDRRGWKRTAELVEKIARALHAAHEAGVVHRDLKPGNVMITPDREPVILDFGLAADLSEDGGPSLTRSGDVFGTPGYMAPEQVRGERADRRVDVWALGVILYETLTLRRPFEAATREALYRRILEHEPPRLRRNLRALPPDLETVAAVALAKEPDRRYATAAAFADDLRAVLEVRPIQARATGPFGRALRFLRRHPAVAALLLTFAVALPALGTLWMSQRSAEQQVGRAREARAAEVRSALDEHDLVRARNALAALRSLGGPAGEADPLEAEIVRREIFERAETIALDAESDPDGRLALEALAEADRAGAGTPAERLMLAAYVSFRSGRTPLAGPLQGLSPENVGFYSGDESSSKEAAVADAGEFDHFGALMLSARGRHREALDALERLLERSPRNHRLAWIAAEEATRLREYRAALALARQHRGAVVDLTPERLARFASHLRLAGHAEEAVRVAEQAAARAPERPMVLLHLANALADADREADALPVFRKVLDLDPKWARAWNAYGAQLMGAGRVPEGLDACRRATELAADDADAWSNLGIGFYRLERFDEAAKAFEHVVSLRPDHPEGLNGWGSAEERLGNLDRARELYERALALNPRYSEPLANLAGIFKRMGLRDAAIKAYRDVLALDPKLADAAWNLAILIHDAEPAEAAKLYRRVIELRPKDADARSNLAHLLADQGGYDEAIDLAREACELGPGDNVNWNTLATILTEAGRPAEAIEPLRRAAVLGPHRVEPQANLMLLLAESDPLEALARGLELVRVDPEVATRAEGNVIQLRPMVRDLDSEHPLHHAIAGQMTRVEDDRSSHFDSGFEGVFALPDGTPRDRDFVLKRAAVGELLRLARVLEDEERGRRLDAEAARLDALVPPKPRS